MAKLEGVHRVKARLRGGKVRVYHYAWRGGPSFWHSDSGVREGSDAYIAALNGARRRRRVTGKLTVPQLVDHFLDSPEFGTKAERTKADYRRWALRFAEEFKKDAAVMFEDPDSRGELLDWRDKWGHSPKQADYAVTVAVRILTWARGRHIKQHHCDRIPKLYVGQDRSEIIWSPADVAAFEARAPEWVKRILMTALETGLRPGDLIRLSWQHIENTPGGRRIRIRTNKRKRLAYIPVTEKMGVVLNATPKDRALILLSERGRPLTEHRASEGVRQWRDKAKLSPDLRLYDCRGTAATKLLMSGATLMQIAAMFGWSLRYAQNVIEAYAAVAPEVSDQVLVLLRGANGT